MNGPWLEYGGTSSRTFSSPKAETSCALPIVAEVKAHHLAPGQAVRRRPAFGLETEQRELERQSIPVRLDKGIQAIGVRLKHIDGLRGKNLEISLGSTIQADGAQETIGLERLLTQDLGKAAGRDSPAELYLPQTVLSMHIALGKEHVVFVLGKDVRRAPRVTVDLYAILQPRDMQRAVHLRPASTHKEQVRAAPCDQQQRQYHDEYAEYDPA